MEVSTTLDAAFPPGVARSDLCLNAELTAHPDNLGIPGEMTPSSAEICLGEDPVTLFQAGATDLFAFYPCVGVTAYPCSTADTLELMVNGGEAARAAGIGRDEPVMEPEKVVVHLPDHNGRHVEGGSLTWRTSASGAGGVTIGENFDKIDSNVWSNFADKLTATNADGGTKPGTMKLCTPNCNTEIADADTGDFEAAYNPDSSFTADIVAIFSELGTYVAKRTTKATHSNGTTYTAMGTYIFHVGPIAELEVQDAGTNPDVQSGRRAFTIRAINNGPDDAPAVQVRVSGLNAGSYVSHSATAGSFDPATGVWTLGEMLEPVALRDIYGRDGEELTIVTSAASGSEITAAISNTQDYQVCIDSSGDDVAAASRSACTRTSGNTWHTTAYFDYISDNNTAAITARAGLAGGAPETRPGLVQAFFVGNANLVFWSEPQTGGEHRHFGAARSWDIEYSDDGGSRWTPLRYRYGGVGGSSYYVDRNAPRGSMRQYRVRARYDERVGDWTKQSEPGAAGATVRRGGRPTRRHHPAATALTMREGGSGQVQRAPGRPARRRTWSSTCPTPTPTCG